MCRMQRTVIFFDWTKRTFVRVICRIPVLWFECVRTSTGNPNDNHINDKYTNKSLFDCAISRECACKVQCRLKQMFYSFFSYSDHVVCILDD